MSNVPTTKQSEVPKVRITNFDFSEIETNENYFANNPFATQFLNSLHIVFPPGEQFFIRAVKEFSKDLNDPELKERIKGFIGQEVTHGRQHEKVWQLLREQGLPVDAFLYLYEKSAYDGLEPFFTSIFGKELALATTAALEHYTATLAEEAFVPEIAEMFPEGMRHLLQWHASEEIEHKSVAFDLLEKVDDSYALRIGGFIIGTAVLLLYGAMGTAMFLASKRSWMTDLKTPSNFFDMLKICGGLVTTFVPKMLQYFKPGFHPNDIENEHLAEEFFKIYEKSILAA